MLLLFLLFVIFLGFLILSIFFLTSKNSSFDCLFNSSFECGFSSYFFSRFSFSVHYFNLGMIFLFLDLELCLIFPYMNEGYSNFLSLTLMLIFVLSLLLGLIQEWLMGLLDWKF